VFVVALILIGVGTFLSAIVVLFIPFLERRLSGISARLERAQMQELEQHVLVCGASPEAVATAKALRAAGARTVIVSPDSQALELLRSEGFRTHLGDPSVEDDLRSVGVDRAKALVVAQASDAENLLTVITARALQPGLRIVAIASSDSSLPKLRRAGANVAVSVVGVAAQLMSSAALGTDSPDGPPSRTAPS
jgi:voltage-gated potassium channel